MDSPLTPEEIFRFCQGKGSAGASILMKDETCMYMYVLHQKIDTVAMTEYYIQLLRERLSETNVHATIPKGNMGYDQYIVPDSVAVKPTFVAFL